MVALSRPQYLEMISKANNKRKFKTGRGAIKKHLCKLLGGNMPVLKLLADKEMPLRMKCAIVDKLSRNELKAVNEIVTNFLNKNIPLDAKSVTKLESHKSQLRAFAKGKADTKKRLLKQRGGFFPLLLPLLGPLLGAAAGGIVKKVFK